MLVKDNTMLISYMRSFRISLTQLTVNNSTLQCNLNVFLYERRTVSQKTKAHPAYIRQGNDWHTLDSVDQMG